MPWIIAAVVLAAVLLRNKPVAASVPRKFTMAFPPTPNPNDWKGWVWPVPVNGNRIPIVSHGFEGGNPINPDGTLNYSTHLGLDVMYPRLDGDPIGPADTVAKSGKFISPIGTQIIAAGPGTIWNAGLTPLGHFIQIDHGNVGTAGGTNTFYQHLDSFNRDWKKGDRVQAGDVLGTMGGDPSNIPHLRHLHFELWFPRAGMDTNSWRIDPAPYMRFWNKTTAQQPMV